MSGQVPGFNNQAIFLPTKGSAPKWASLLVQSIGMGPQQSSGRTQLHQTSSISRQTLAENPVFRIGGRYVGAIEPTQIELDWMEESQFCQKCSLQDLAILTVK